MEAFAAERQDILDLSDADLERHRRCLDQLLEAQAQVLAEGTPGRGAERDQAARILAEEMPAAAPAAMLLRHFAEHPKGCWLLRHIPQGTAAPGVTGLSAGVARGLLPAIYGPEASYDSRATNLAHLTAVCQGTVPAKARALGRPLRQQEFDAVVVETLLTDLFAKGFTVARLPSLRLAPMRLATGETVRDGRAFWQGACEHDWRRRLAEESAEVRVNLETLQHAPCWPEELPPGVDADTRAAWSRFLFGQPYQIGIVCHGIIAHEWVDATLQRTGLDPAGVYAAVLGHHMAGFVAYGFYRGGTTVDFDRLAGDAISGEDARHIGALYDAAILLSGTWRPRVDWNLDPALTPDDRARFTEDARSLRLAIAALPERQRSQLLYDDIQQFVPAVGLPKWLAYVVEQHGELSNGQLLMRLYLQVVQPYLEENASRGPDVLQAFVSASAVGATRLGMTFGAVDGFASHFHAAVAGEDAHWQLAKNILDNVDLCADFMAEHHESHLPDKPDALLARRLVDWFRAQPASPIDLARLAGT
jgi:hypothetical protein